MMMDSKEMARKGKMMHDEQNKDCKDMSGEMEKMRQRGMK